MQWNLQDLCVTFTDTIGVNTSSHARKHKCYGLLLFTITTWNSLEFIYYSPRSWFQTIENKFNPVIYSFPFFSFLNKSSLFSIIYLFVLNQTQTREKNDRKRIIKSFVLISQNTNHYPKISVRLWIGAYKEHRNVFTFNVKHEWTTLHSWKTGIPISSWLTELN